MQWCHTMHEVKGTVKFVDGAGRVVALTDTNQTALVNVPDGVHGLVGGDRLTLIQNEPPFNNRISDWKIIEIERLRWTIYKKGA